MRNFKRNEQELYEFNVWLLTNGECIPYMAMRACMYLSMMDTLKEMNE